MAVLNFRLRASISGFLVAVAVGQSTIGAEDHSRATALEYQVKAAYLYNFAKFVDWPADKLFDGSGPILVGVLGKDPFGSVLDNTLKGKTVRGHTLEARRASAPAALKQCHIVFIAEPEQRRRALILQWLGTHGVLTVVEMGQFVDEGGMIKFVTDENKVHLDINLGAAERAAIRISSQLLKLARVVYYN